MTSYQLLDSLRHISEDNKAMARRIEPMWESFDDKLAALTEAFEGRDWAPMSPEEFSSLAS